MSWLEEIGEKRFDDKDFVKAAKVLSMLGTIATDDADEEKDFTSFVFEAIDTAIFNLTELKKKLEEETK